MNDIEAARARRKERIERFYRMAAEQAFRQAHAKRGIPVDEAGLRRSQAAARLDLPDEVVDQLAEMDASSDDEVFAGFLEDAQGRMDRILPIMYAPIAKKLPS